MPSIDHLPEAPLQLLRDLLQAITVHVEKIRQLLMAASDGQGCSFASSDRKNHSALNMEAADYVQVLTACSWRTLARAGCPCCAHVFACICLAAICEHLVRRVRCGDALSSEAHCTAAAPRRAADRMRVPFWSSTPANPTRTCRTAGTP